MDFKNHITRALKVVPDASMLAAHIVSTFVENVGDAQI